MRKTAAKFDYHRLGRADRSRVRAYIGKVCGFSPAQTSRLLRQHAETGAVEDRRARNSGRPFERVYTPAGIRLLAAVDEAFGGMSALATREVLRREFEVHGDPRFERLAGVSRSHMYNLRATRAYKTRRTRWEKTRSSPVSALSWPRGNFGGVLHARFPDCFSSACLSTLAKVPGGTSTPSLPDTATVPALFGCWNWRWLPRVSPAPSHRFGAT